VDTRKERGNLVVACVALFVVVVVVATITNFVINGVSGRATISLTTKIPLAPSSGKFDHLDLDPTSNRLFICVKENNSLAIVDIKTNTQIRTIPVPQPKAVIFTFLNDVKKLWITTGTGLVLVLDADQYEQIDQFEFGLGGDCDNARFDSLNNLIYVAYGALGNGSIGIIDALHTERLADANSENLRGHPEAFYVSGDGRTVYVNVPPYPTGPAVLAIDSTLRGGTGTYRVFQLPPGEQGNYPMLMMEQQQVLVLPTRTQHLVVMSSVDGRIISYSQGTVGDSDDVFYFPENKRLFVVGGDGRLQIYQGDDSGTTWNSKGTTQTGWLARTGFLVESTSTLYVPVPSNSTLRYGSSVYVFNIDP